MDSPLLTQLPDSELLERVQRIVRNERRATAALIAHLAEIENRKLYLQEACRSMFNYCTQRLHLSEHAAYYRIEAARLAVRFPAVLASLESGDIHLTAVRLLAPILTPENHREWLAAAKHKSKREVEELIAITRPQPDVATSIRKVPVKRGSGRRPGRGPAPAAAPAPTASFVEGPQQVVANAMDGERAAAAGNAAADATQTVDPGLLFAPASAARPAEVVPLGSQRYKIQFTASGATRDKLRRAQELLRHRIPGGNVAEIVDHALDVLLHTLEKKKFAATDRQRPTSMSASGASVPSSRYIAADVKRAVWQRDQGRCAFVSPSGARCAERGGLEFDHIRPRGDGGGASVENVRLLCRQHNQYEAQQFFGQWKADAGPDAAQR